MPPPRLRGAGEPRAEDIPAFVEALAAALSRALDAPPLPTTPEQLAPFARSAVFARVEAVGRGLAPGIA